MDGNIEISKYDDLDQNYPLARGEGGVYEFETFNLEEAMSDWKETIQALYGAVRVNLPLMPQGIPIEAIPDDWKDRRKVLVYGTGKWEDWDDHDKTWSRWFVARYEPECRYDHEGDGNAHGGWIACSENPYADYVIPTHFLPYPADPV